MVKSKIYEERLNAEDREAAQKGAKGCWNKFTRLTDKFIEAIFIVTLGSLGVWGILR